MKKIFTKTGCRVHIFRNDKQKDSEPFTFIALNSEWAEITYLEEITILNESEFVRSRDRGIAQKQFRTELEENNSVLADDRTQWVP